MEQPLPANWQSLITGTNVTEASDAMNHARLSAAPQAVARAAWESMRQPAAWALLALLAITFTVYAPTFGYGLLDWDDKLHILLNPHFGDLRAAWSQAQVHVYMPVTWSLWGTAWELGNGNPGWLHGLNVFGHLLGVALAYRVLLLLPGLNGGNPTARWSAIFGAACFALHPVQVEPVAWVTSLKDVASADFALIAMWLHLRASASRSTIGHIAAVVALGIATLAKPTVVAIVGGLFVIHLAAGRSVWRRDLVATGLSMVVVALPALFLTATAQFGASQPPYIEPAARVLVAVDAWGSAVQSIVWPGSRLGMAGRSPSTVLAGQAWITTGLILAAALALGIGLRKRWPELLWGIAFMVALLLPVSGLLAFGAQANTTVADRYLHLALLGPAWAMAALASRLINEPDPAWVRPAAVLVGLTLLGTWTTLSVTQVAAWSDDRALWQHTLKHDPSNRLALELMAQQHNRHGEHDQAIALSRRALALDASHAKAHHSLGIALARTNRLQEALPSFRAAVLSEGRWLTAWRSLIRVTRDLSKPGVLVETAKQLAAEDPAKSIDPATNPELAVALAEAYLQIGDYPAVIALLERALSFNEPNADAHAILGFALGSLHELAPALRHFERALALQPDHPVALQNIEIARSAVQRQTP